MHITGIVRAAAVGRVHHEITEQKQHGAFQLRPEIAIASRGMVANIERFRERIFLALHDEGDVLPGPVTEFFRFRDATVLPEGSAKGAVVKLVQGALFDPGRQFAKTAPERAETTP
jgi:hypothetical protein